MTLTHEDRRHIFWAILLVALLLILLAFAPVRAECPETYPEYERLCEGGPAKTRKRGCHDLLRWEPVEHATYYIVDRRRFALLGLWREVAVLPGHELCTYETPEGTRHYWFYEGEASPPPPSRMRRYRVRAANYNGVSDPSRSVVRLMPDDP